MSSYYGVLPRRIYESNKEHYREIRKLMKNYINEDFEIATKLGVKNADKYYLDLAEELKAPMSKTHSPIYLLAKDVGEPACLIADLENFRMQYNLDVDDVVDEWIRDKYFSNVLRPVQDEMDKLLFGGEQ